jgi:hypothetical protein
MKKKQDPFEGIFDGLQDNSSPTDEQKQKMLDYVLSGSDRLQEKSVWEKIFRWIADYPWRFAFGAAAAQAVVCTSLFGTGYTNLFLRMFGG